MGGDELARWLRGVSSGSSLGPSDFALGLGCLFPAARGAAQPRPTRTHHWIDCFASLHAQRCGQAPKGLVASGVRRGRKRTGCESQPLGTAVPAADPCPRRRSPPRAASPSRLPNKMPFVKVQNLTWMFLY